MFFFQQLFIVAIMALCAFYNQNILAEGKVLEEKQMGLISLGIVLDPTFMVDAWITKELAQKTLNILNTLKDEIKKNNTKKPQDEQAFVQKQKALLVNRLAVCFGPVRQHKNMVIPLVLESLGTSSKCGNYETTPPILVKFFNSDLSMSVESFFDKEVQTIDALTAMSKEVVTFFNDLEVSLSNLARQKYESARQAKIMQFKKSVM